MKEPIISVSGLRGIVGESLTPAVAMNYTAAYLDELPDGPVVLSRDGRATGPMLADIIRGSLASLGRTCLDAGVAATPTAGILVRQHRAAGGIQVSASHNPPEYNGMKLFGGDGRVISEAAGAEVSDRYRKMEEGKENDSNRWASHDRVAVARSLDDTIGRHLESILKIVAAQRIRAAKFRVVLDSNHGAGSVLGRPLLEALGCDVEVLGGTPDGRFDHPPEPLAANLASVSPAIPQLGAAVGFCQDPDADRLAVIDENGCYLGEEYTLALCVDRVLRHTPGPVVANCSTSRMTEDLAKRYGAPFYRTAVGEVNVADAMLREGAVVGGEGSGGVIDPRVGLVRDSFVGMALILDAMAERGLPIGALAAELPRYEMHRAKASLPREMIASGLDSLQRRFHDAVPDRRDGLRLDWADRWLIVRPSNTEPIVRIVAEAPDADQAKALCDAAAATLGVAR